MVMGNPKTTRVNVCSWVSAFLVGCVYALAMTSSGCRRPVEPSGTRKPFATLAPADSFREQGFGASVALSGDQVIVTAFSDGSEERGFAKSSYVFSLITKKETVRLIPPGDIRPKLRPWVVAADGPWAAVTACMNTPPGAVYVFDLKTGEHKITLKHDDICLNDYFGNSMSLKGFRVLVGAPGAVRGAGAAYVFDIKEGKQVLKLVSENAQKGDFFGHSVALSDSFALVGAPWTDVSGKEDSGAVYVFDLRTGRQVSVLTPARNVSGRIFGFSLAASGDMVVIGSPVDSTAPQDRGAAYIYNMRTGGTITELKPADDSAVNWFGMAVGISEQLVVVAAQHGDTEEGKKTGVVYVFDPATGQELARLVSGNPNPNASGWARAVAVNAKWIAIGAIDEDSGTNLNAGLVHSYRVADVCSKPCPGQSRSHDQNEQSK